MLYPARLHTIETPMLCERDVAAIAEIYARHRLGTNSTDDAADAFDTFYAEGELYAADKLSDETAFLRVLRTDNEPTGLVSGDLLRPAQQDAYLGLGAVAPELCYQGWESKLARMFMATVPTERVVTINRRGVRVPINEAMHVAVGSRAVDDSLVVVNSGKQA